MSSGADGEYTFAVCLTHDVDRVFKTYQYVWNALQDRNPRELVGVFTPENPYWTFERVMDIEAGLGVRSSFNVLDEMPITERPKREWFTKTGWQLFGGRYDVEDPAVTSTLRVLEAFGWEIGLHGSYTSAENPERFAQEKAHIESVVGAEILGNRQHYWNLDPPDTWRHLREAGIKYDTSLGSSTDLDFQGNYDLRRPFDDEFVVFPWSLMDGAAMRAGDTVADSLRRCRDVLQETRDHRSVLVLNWHGGDVFSERDYSGWGEVYERLIERALEMGAWVGPPGTFYEALNHPNGTVETALDTLATEPRLSPGRSDAVVGGDAALDSGVAVASEKAADDD